MSKKKEKEIVRERKTFIYGDVERGIPGAIANGIPEDVAGSIYDEILDFANYAFNKAHAVSYAIVAYRTAYMKCHWPREYMAALITSVLDSSGKVAEYIAECRDMGIRLLPPDVNESDADFTVVGDDLRFGMAAVKNVGRGFVKTLMAERERGGRFTAFDEFCRRMYGQDLNRRAIESLIRAGAFDSLGYKRKALLQVLDTVLDSVTSAGRKNVAGQMDLFGMDADDGGAAAETMVLPDVEEFSPDELMRMEREMTGLYLSGHPMDGYRDTARRLGAVPIGTLLGDFAGENGPERFADGQSITVAGIIGSYKTRTTKNNSMMAYVTLEDDSGFMELILFQRALDAARQYLKENEAVVVRGRISVRDEKEPQIMVDSVRPLADPAGRQAPDAQAPQAPRLWLRLRSDDKKALRKIELLLEMFPGGDQMVVYFADTGKRMGAKCVIHNALVRELQELLGEENVAVK